MPPVLQRAIAPTMARPLTAYLSSTLSHCSTVKSWIEISHREECTQLIWAIHSMRQYWPLLVVSSRLLGAQLWSQLLVLPWPWQWIFLLLYDLNQHKAEKVIYWLLFFTIILHLKCFVCIFIEPLICTMFIVMIKELDLQYAAVFHVSRPCRRFGDATWGGGGSDGRPMACGADWREGAFPSAKAGKVSEQVALLVAEAMARRDEKLRIASWSLPDSLTHRSAPIGFCCKRIKRQQGAADNCWQWGMTATRYEGQMEWEWRIAVLWLPMDWPPQPEVIHVNVLRARDIY